MYFLQRIACDIDFNDSEAYAGTSYWPFIGFMCFFIGLVVAFIGIVKISNSKHQWNLFYDQRDSVNIDKATNQKNKNAGIIMMAAGLMFLIISFFVI